MENVNSANHHYSFSKNGADIGRHRGILQPGDFRMSKVISNIFRIAYNNDNLPVGIEEYANTVTSFSRAIDVEAVADEDPETRIKGFSYDLRRKYGIRLFLLGTNEPKARR
jgi:hypothetical protein